MAKEKPTTSDVLSLEDVQLIAADAVMGRPSKLQTPAAIAYREKMNAFVEQAKKDGRVVDIPFEYPAID